MFQWDAPEYFYLLSLLLLMGSGYALLLLWKNRARLALCPRRGRHEVFRLRQLDDEQLSHSLPDWWPRRRHTQALLPGRAGLGGR